MGLAASASGVLSCFMNCNSLNRNAENILPDAKTNQEHTHQHNEAIGMTKDTTISFAQLDH